MKRERETGGLSFWPFSSSLQAHQSLFEDGDGDGGGSRAVRQRTSQTWNGEEGEDRDGVLPLTLKPWRDDKVEDEDVLCRTLELW